MGHIDQGRERKRREGACTDHAKRNDNNVTHLNIWLNKEEIIYNANWVGCLFLMRCGCTIKWISTSCWTPRRCLVCICHLRSLILCPFIYCCWMRRMQMHRLTSANAFVWAESGMCAQLSRCRCGKVLNDETIITIIERRCVCWHRNVCARFTHSFHR